MTLKEIKRMFNRMKQNRLVNKCEEYYGKPYRDCTDFEVAIMEDILEADDD